MCDASHLGTSINNNKAGAQAPATNNEKDMIQEFVNYLTINKGYSLGTGDGYKKDLTDFARWLQSQAKISRWRDVTADEVNDYVADMATNGQAPATIKRRVSAIRSMFNWARQQRITDMNPARFVSTPKKWERVPKTLNVETIKQTIYDRGVEIRTRAMITAMVETGCRIGEVVAMNVEDIDRQEQSIVVRGKGKKERTVYYGAMFKAYLDNHESRTHGSLFNKPYDEARREIHFALARHTGDGSGSSHMIRHTFATTMLNAGADIMAISQLLGHASVKTTERYAKASSTHVRAEYQQYARV